MLCQLEHFLFKRSGVARNARRSGREFSAFGQERSISNSAQSRDAKALRSGARRHTPPYFFAREIATYTSTISNMIVM